MGSILDAVLGRGKARRLAAVVAGVSPADLLQFCGGMRVACRFWDPWLCSRHGCLHRGNQAAAIYIRLPDFGFLWWHACRVQLSSKACRVNVPSLGSECDQEPTTKIRRLLYSGPCFLYYMLHSRSQVNSRASSRS